MGAGCLLYACGTAEAHRARRPGRASCPWVFIFYMVAAVSISGMALLQRLRVQDHDHQPERPGRIGTWLALGMEIAAVGTFLSVGIKLPYFAFYGAQARVQGRGEAHPLQHVRWPCSWARPCASSQGIFPEICCTSYLPFQDGIAPYTEYVAASATAYHPWHPVAPPAGLPAPGLHRIGVSTSCARSLSRTGKLNMDFEWFYRLVRQGLVMWLI